MLLRKIETSSQYYYSKLCCSACIVCVTSTHTTNNKIKEICKKQKKQLCSFLFFDASGFSVHNVTAHVTEGGQGGLC